ncbi:MAG: hypothetical protein AABY02_02305, partial [Nanoarchaeota archaeon]
TGTVTVDDITTTGKPGELSGSTSTILLTTLDLKSGDKVQVAALVAGADSAAKSCNPNPVKVTCA